MLLDECRRFAARYEPPLLEVAQAQPPHANDPTPGRRLRIGYVSPDFRSHCQALFTAPLFSHHDRAAFEIVCYASVPKPDALTQYLKRLVDGWREVHTLDDNALAQQIRGDRIDILVDLTMHMAGGRRLLFARRPAPVQVAWLAYPGTTGSAAMDYRLTDPWLDPIGEPGCDALYSERSLRLPDAFWCYDAQVAGLEVNALPATGGAPFTFGCLNNPAKIGDRALRLWSRVLAAVPHACLLLPAPPGAPRERLEARAQAPSVVKHSKSTSSPYSSPIRNQKKKRDGFHHRASHQISHRTSPACRTSRFSRFSAAFPRARSIARVLPLAEKLLIGHDRPVGMRRAHMRDVALVIRQTHHQPHGLAEIAPGRLHVVAKSREHDALRSVRMAQCTRFAAMAAPPAGIASYGVSCVVGWSMRRARAIAISPYTTMLTTTRMKRPESAAST